jgi:hypothetical protein
MKSLFGLVACTSQLFGTMSFQITSKYRQCRKGLAAAAGVTTSLLNIAGLLDRVVPLLEIGGRAIVGLVIKIRKVT